MKEKYLVFSLKETKNLAKRLAKYVLKNGPNVIALYGELGSGKTTFIKGFAKGLGVKDLVLSPTFVLIKKFKLNLSNFKNFYHIDCFRIKSKEEIENLGFDQIISPKNIVAIEWAEKIKEVLPKNRIDIFIRPKDKNTREIKIKVIKKK